MFGNKAFLFAFSIIGVLLISSCSKSSEKKVGFLLPNLSAGRYVKEKEYFSEKIKEIGGEAIVLSADYSDQTQIEQANELIEQGVKVLVINAVNMNTAAAIVRNAHDNNVKVIAYDRLISNCELDYFLTFDSRSVGLLMAEYVTNLKPNGKYILLGGDKSDKNAVWVREGMIKGLTPYTSSGKIKVLHDVYVEDWAGDNAAHVIEKVLDLSGDTPDAILTAYDGMTTEVIKVLKRYDLAGKTLITGQDAELDACQNIVKGNQTMTIYKSVRSLAGKAAEISMKIVDGKEITEATSAVNNNYMEVPTIFLDPKAIDKGSIKAVISDGFHSEADVFKQ